MKKKHINIILSFLVITLFQISYITIAKANLFFASDSELRLIQAHGIKESSFSYGNLFYPGGELDPSYKIHPYVEDYYIHDFNEKKITHFPILYAYISAAILYLLPPASLVFFNSLCILFTLLSLVIFWKIDWKLVLFAYFGTFISVISFDNSEYPLFLFLQFSGLSILLGDAFDKKWYHYIFSGFLMGLACWLKVEALLFVVSLFLAYVLIYKFLDKKILKNYFILGFVFSLILISFFIFNYLNYKHFLGPAFSINEKLYGLTPRWLIALTLFVGWNKLGLLTYNPMFLFLIIFFIKKENFLSMRLEKRILFVATLIFIFLVCLTAPTDGFVSWGPRYLILALLPMTLLFHDLIIFPKISIFNNKFLFRSLIIFSVLCTFLGLYLIKEINKVRNEFQRDFSLSSSEIKIYDSKILTMFMGLNYFKDQNFLIKTNVNLEEFSNNLKKFPKYKNITFYKLNLEDKFSNIFSSQELPREEINTKLNQKYKFKNETKMKYFIAYDYEI